MEETVRPAPTAVDVRTSTAGLRAVATLEAAKGIAVVLLMLLIFIVHRHAADVAESLLFHLHIGSDWHLSQVVMNAATTLSDTRLLTIAVAALSYVTVRGIEAWGLWHRRVWAEWFAMLSGALYIPLEILKFIEHPNWLHLTVVIINVIIVLYMVYIRLKATTRPGSTVLVET